jgi:hypothetical protein
MTAVTISPNNTPNGIVQERTNKSFSRAISPWVHGTDCRVLSIAI